MVTQTPWQAPIPTPYQIPYYSYDGSPNTTDPETGNTVRTWAPAKMVSVQQWDILSSEELGEHAQAEHYEGFLMTPPEFWPAINDRFGLPIPSNQMVAPTTMFDANGAVNPGIFEVVGHDIEDSNSAAWRPGNITLIKRVEG